MAAIKFPINSIDSTGRLLVSQGSQVFHHKNLHGDRSPDDWSERTSGAGETISLNTDTSSVELTIGTGATEFALRQSREYIRYIPGDTQSVSMTTTFSETKANNVQEAGYGDDEDGVFFISDENGLAVVLRTSTSGSVVETVVRQADWNIDKLDGTGGSRVQVNANRNHLLNFDFLWLGAGPVRFGMVLEDKLIWCHTIQSDNDLQVPFMKTPSLPIRYKIYNTGVTASSSMLIETCSSVDSDGQSIPGGYGHSISNGIVLRSSTVRIPILAIRLKNIFKSLDNRRTMMFSGASGYVTGNAGYLEIMRVHNPSAITATWSDVSLDDSGMEFSTDITAVTGTSQQLMTPLYVPTGSGNKGNKNDSQENVINRHNFIFQNFESDNSDMFVCYMTPFSGTCNASSAMNVIEFE